MTKADIIERIYGVFEDISRKEAAEYVDAMFEVIKKSLERGEQVKVSGFGNFVISTKRARPGRNPQTGEEILITARRVLTFKPSQVLKAALNAQDRAGESVGG